MTTLLRKAIRILAFPFLADPPIPEHQKYEGIRQFPGFHTTKDFNVAAMYALGRVDQNFTVYPDDYDAGPAYVTDYPVVVELDMTGHDPKTDYDAEEIVKDSLDAQLGELIKELAEHPTELHWASDEEIEAKLQEYIDMAEIQYSEYNESALDFLGEQTFMHFSSPLSTVLDQPNAAEIVRQYAQNRSIPKNVLMEAADQYRYTEDVDEERIVKVYFIMPIANELADDYEDETIAKKWPGFDIIGPDEAYGGYFDPRTQLVWEREHDGPTEFHGSTYNRLLSAAPFLSNEIPVPPSPPYEGSE